MAFAGCRLCHTSRGKHRAPDLGVEVEGQPDGILADALQQVWHPLPCRPLISHAGIRPLLSTYGPQPTQQTGLQAFRFPKH